MNKSFRNAYGNAGARGQTTSETVNTPLLPYLVSFVGWSSRHWVQLTPAMRREAAVTAVLIGVILSGEDVTQCSKASHTVVFCAVIPCCLVPGCQRFRGKQAVYNYCVSRRYPSSCFYLKHTTFRRLYSVSVFRLNLVSWAQSLELVPI
jgi:hypothetical protein